MQKIFGIGLPKTGTSSLSAALKILGYQVCDFPSDESTVAELRAGNYQLSILKQFDALTDIPIPAIYPQLDTVYPNSKFILTVRDLNSWLDSCRHAPFNQLDAVPKPGTKREFYRTLLYGCNQFNEDRFTWVYHSHLKLVYDYFSAEKQPQFLVLDIFNGDGWDKLCEFLEKNIPNEPFPHKNPRLTSTNNSNELIHNRNVTEFTLPKKVRRLGEKILKLK